MATDSANLPQGETYLAADSDMSGGELDPTQIQLAQTDGAQPVELPKGNLVAMIPVRPGQVIELPTDSTDGLLAKIGPEGNLAIVVDGRTIILQGYVSANDQAPVRIVTNDGDGIDTAELIAITDPSLDIQTAAGPAAGAQANSADGSGIYIPFAAGPGLGGLDAAGILDPTSLRYKLIDDEPKQFNLEEQDTSPDFGISFDVLGGTVNEDDLPGDAQEEQFQFVFKEGGNNGEGNDPFDGTDRDDNDGDGIPDESDNNSHGADPDREPISTVATIKVDFHGDVPGKLEVDASKLPAGLKSGGEPISFAIDPAVAGAGGHGNGIFGYVESGGGAGYQPGIDRLVFEVHVDKSQSDGEFKVTFTLHDNIDNAAPDLNKDGSPDLLGADEQLLGLPVQFTITDSDGSSVAGTLPIQLVDDVPAFGEVVGVGADMEIVNITSGLTHDETPGVDNPDDQNPGDLGSLPQDLVDFVLANGFSQPTEGESKGTLPGYGVAQSQVIASFGADGGAAYQAGSKGDSIRDSVHGAISGSGENEHPFELFMIEPGKGSTPKEDNKATVGNEGNLTAADQKSNVTVTWNGQELPVYLHQIDAHTIVGYVIPEIAEQSSAIAFKALAVGQEAVFVINIDDAGILTFVQLHQVNHPDFPGNHDEGFSINAEDGETPLVHVRITDFDGDHATQPVNIVIEDDGPRFTGVDYDEGNGTVDEDALPLGNGDSQAGDDAGGKHTDGTINFDFGADEPGNLEVSNLTAKDSAGNVILDLAVDWASFDPVDGSIDVTGLNNLKTADGHAIVVSATLDDGTGILTLVGKDATDDQPAFTFKLHTTDPGIGDFDFTLQQALQHPFTDPDLANDGPETLYEDDLDFDFTVVGKDVDGDAATGHINVKVDDDSPKAESDVDRVTEGEDNFASGNVVTGDPATAFADDANSLDGNPDHPGADRPYTISKLTHDGVTYELSVDGQGVSNLGPDDSFDATTGILTIKTAEGGTFQIVMVSDDQSQVGDYKYTVGPNPSHAEDVVVGPTDIAASRTDAFNNVGAWQSAFTTGGINLVANGGNLAIKGVDVNPKAGFGGAEDYRGIGVDTGIDNVEVDTQNESLTLEFDPAKFPGGVNNAAVLIGALFDGVQFDSGFQEILKWEAYDGGTLVASGQIVGDHDGLVSLDIDAGANFNKIVLTPLNNGAGKNSDHNSDFLLVNVEVCQQEPAKEKFDYTVRDADGDESTATLKIDVKDTQPTTPPSGSGTLHLTVDEDGLPAGVGNSDSPNDAAATSASASGFIAFTPGADPVRVELSVGNGGDTGLKTLSGQKVFAAWDAASETLIGYIAGKNPNDAANQVFKMTVTDHDTGAVNFELLQPLKHPDGGADDNTENNPDLLLTVNVEIEDKDCDVAFTTVKVKIDDDMPVANALTKSATTPEGVDTNLLITLDLSGSMSQESGMTDLTKLEAAVAAIKELIEQYDAHGDVKVRLVTFDTVAEERGTQWMTVQEARDLLDSLSAGNGSTNFDDALTDAMGAFPDTGKIAGARNVAYFLSDGNPNEPAGDAGIDGAEEAEWINFLKANDINSFALGFGKAGDVNQSALDPIAYDGKSATNTNATVITDLNLLTATLAATVTPAVTGNLKTDGGNKIGADNPGIVSQIAFGGNTFAYNGVSVSRTTGSATWSSVGAVLTFSTASFQFQIDMNTGAYSYLLLADASVPLTDTLGYTLKDADGDTAANTLTISSDGSDVAPIVRDDYIIAGHDDHKGSENIVVPGAALLWNDSDANGDAITVGNTFTNLHGSVSVALGIGDLTITDDKNGGGFTYTGTANGKSDTGDVVLDRSQEGHNSLDGNGLDNIIVSDDSSNSLNGKEGNDVLLGNGGDDTLDGGAGRDWLVGGAGSNTVTGGAGNDLVDVSGGDDTVRYTSKLDGHDVIVGFDANPTGGQDVIHLDPLFDNLGISSGSRSALVDIAAAGGNTVIKVDVDGVAGFTPDDIQITVIGVTGLTKGNGADDVILGS